MKTFNENRRAHFDYEILEKYTAGVELLGFEVKSIRRGSASLNGSFVIIRGNEMYLVNCAIPPYQVKNTPANYDPTRARRLLLTKKEIAELAGSSKQKGLSLIPLRFWAPKHLVKLEFAIAKGKKKSDKRESIKKRDTEREMRKAIK